MNRSIDLVIASVCALVLSLCLGCSDSTTQLDKGRSVGDTVTTDDEGTDIDKIQGMWGAVSYVENGQGGGEIVDARESAIRFFFEADKFTILASGNAGESPKGTFKLAPTKKPKSIDMVFSPSQGEQTTLGIYEFEGSTLKLCYGFERAKRPTEFKSRPGSGHNMIVFERLDLAVAEPAERNRVPARLASAQAGTNLIRNPSLEEPIAGGGLPRGWSTYPVGKPTFRYEVVAGGHTGNRCLRIEAGEAGACVFTNGVSLDRTKRYALKGWARFEGDKNARAIINLTYFHNRKWLGKNASIGVTSNQEGWQLLEKTDIADGIPEASQIWVTCSVGGGTAWFDDLELVAYDREGLAKDFDSRHGKDNLASRLLVLDRWAGQWESTRSHKPIDVSAQADDTVGISNVTKDMGGRLLRSHWTSKDGDEEALSLFAYDDESAVYRLWTFSSRGASMEFAGQWDDATSTMTLQLVPPAPGVTGTNITRLVDADTIETSVILKNTAGIVARDTRETLTRRENTAASDIPPARGAATTQQSSEQKVLDRGLGKFHQTLTFFKAEWTPEETQETGTASIARILSGRFVEAKLELSDGSTLLMLATYDEQRKCYRRWEFHSNGQAGDRIGKWDADAKCMTWSGSASNGSTSTTIDRYVDADTLESNLVIKDRSGKVCLHVEAKSVRTE